MSDSNKAERSGPAELPRSVLAFPRWLRPSGAAGPSSRGASWRFLAGCPSNNRNFNVEEAAQPHEGADHADGGAEQHHHEADLESVARGDEPALPEVAVGRIATVSARWSPTTAPIAREALDHALEP